MVYEKYAPDWYAQCWLRKVRVLDSEVGGVGGYRASGEGPTLAWKTGAVTPRPLLQPTPWDMIG